MKVEGPSKSGKTDKTKKSDGAKKTGDAGFSSMVSETGGAKEAAPKPAMSGIAPAAALDALLSIQEASDSTSEEAKARAKKRADDILGHLDNIRLGLLTGGIAVKDLQDLASTIADHREKILDPQLNDILDEIELRAHVELAKFDRDRP
jgi:hypothetical protein